MDQTQPPLAETDPAILKRRQPLAPGATVGIVGGGQLGRMLSMAANRLGYRVHIFTPDEDSPAAQVSAQATVADYSDEAALHAFASSTDVITFEFENIPHQSVQWLNEHVSVRPRWESLHITQNRIREKTFLRDSGVELPPFRAVSSADDLALALEDIGRPAVLKTAQMGYDGKGQVMINQAMTAEEAWKLMGANEGVLEAFVDLACEISVVLARGLDGSIQSYPAVENLHKNHILHTTTYPASVSNQLASDADQAARTIAEALDYVGVMAVELFVTKAGKLLVNEIAPRPHNSGHWTIDACSVSQFEQGIRAVCGLPLGDPTPHSRAIMTNMIGNDVDDWLALNGEPGAIMHLYGKKEARPGRKMGHVTRLTGPAI